MDNIRKELANLALSALTVVLFVIAIIVFIDYGGSAIFYAVVVLALASGFLNAWLISRDAPERHVVAMPSVKMRTTKGRGRKQRR